MSSTSVGSVRARDGHPSRRTRHLGAREPENSFGKRNGLAAPGWRKTWKMRSQRYSGLGLDAEDLEDRDDRTILSLVYTTALASKPVRRSVGSETRVAKKPFVLGPIRCVAEAINDEHLFSASAMTTSRGRGTRTAPN